MKYLSALIVTLIFTSSCSGLQQVTQNESKNTNDTEVVFAETQKEDHH